MKALNLITLLLIIVGGLNWGLFGVAQTDLVATIFGGSETVAAKAIYVIIGLSALYQLLPFARATTTDEVLAEANVRHARYP